MLGINRDNFTTYPDKKGFPFTPGSDQSREAASKAAKAHLANRRAAIESKAGRPVTDAEYMAGRLDHVDDRTADERNRQESFHPVKAPEGKYAKHKADLLRRIEEQKVASMSTLERQLYDIERLEQQDAERIAEQNAREAHLNNPRVKAALKELTTLRDSMLWDSSRTKGDIAKVENAIKQWQAHDADAAHSEIMLREILDSEDARTEQIEDAKREQIRQIEATLLGDRKPRKVVIERTGDLTEDGHRLFNAMSDAGFPFDDVDRVYSANRLNDEGDSEALERLLDAYAE